MNSFLDVWNIVKEQCKSEISDVGFDVWFEPIKPLRSEGTTAYLYVPTPYHKNFLTQTYLPLLEKNFKEVFGSSAKVIIQCEEDLDNNFNQDNQVVSPEPTTNTTSNQSIIDTQINTQPINENEQVDTYSEINQEEQTDEYSNLDKGTYDYTFDTFIVGGSNQFAYAACKGVVEKGADPCSNPLFIHGPSGLGKTHLLCAIRHELLKNNPNMKILYISAEKFTNDLIYALKTKTTEKFHDKYRKADVLLMDDVQFISGKDSTQEELFHTFNEMYQLGKQIVLTSDRPPNEIKVLEERLRNRFVGGLLADVGLPDFETRIAIITRKAELLNFYIPDEVAHYIATYLKSNIRQLEGAVKKLRAIHILQGLKPNNTIAQQVIKGILNDTQPTPVTVGKIIEEVAKTYAVSPDDIKSNKRSANISNARQVCAYAIREITQMSQNEIGESLGNRNHSTVTYYIKTIQERIETDNHVKGIIEDIIKNIKNS